MKRMTAAEEALRKQAKILTTNIESLETEIARLKARLEGLADTRYDILAAVEQMFKMRSGKKEQPHE